MNISIIESSGGGKAGRGHNKTASIQVRDYCLQDPNSYLLKGQFRFVVGDYESRLRAMNKAKAILKAEVAAAFQGVPRNGEVTRPKTQAQ